MKKPSRSGLVGMIPAVLVMLLAGFVMTGCGGKEVPADHWKAEYFDNRALHGRPALVDDGGTGFLDFNGDSASALKNTRFRPGNYSVRWARTMSFDEGTHRFRLVSDDGVRFSIDGRIVLDRWSDQPPTEYAVDAPLPAGDHLLQIEYYDHAPQSVVQLSWQIMNTAPVSRTVGFKPRIEILGVVKPGRLMLPMGPAGIVPPPPPPHGNPSHLRPGANHQPPPPPPHYGKGGQPQSQGGKGGPMQVKGGNGKGDPLAHGKGKKPHGKLGSKGTTKEDKPLP